MAAPVSIPASKSPAAAAPAAAGGSRAEKYSIPIGVRSPKLTASITPAANPSDRASSFFPGRRHNTKRPPNPVESPARVVIHNAAARLFCSTTPSPFLRRHNHMLQHREDMHTGGSRGPYRSKFLLRTKQKSPFPQRGKDFIKPFKRSDQTSSSTAISAASPRRAPILMMRV